MLRTSVSNDETKFATVQMFSICKPLSTGLPFVGSTYFSSCLSAVLLKSKKKKKKRMNFSFFGLFLKFKPL